VAAIRAVGIRGDPCGAMRWTVQRIAPQGGTDLLPDDDLLRLKHVGVPLSIFIVF